jgi:exonuclease III
MHGIARANIRRREKFTIDELLADMSDPNQEGYADAMAANSTAACVVDGPSPNALQKIATFNVNGILQTERRLQLVRWANASGIGIVGVQETHLFGTGRCALTYERAGGTWELLASGVPKCKVRKSGVALLLSPLWARQLIEWDAVSDRIITARFTCKTGDISVVVGYAPHEKCPADEKEAFFHAIAQTIAKIGGARTFVLGDFNAQLRTSVERRHTIGAALDKWCSPTANTANPDHLHALGLAVTDSFHHQPHPSFVGYDGRIAFLDHILVPPSQRAGVTTVSVDPYAALDSDHRPVVATLKRLFAEERRSIPRPKPAPAIWLRNGGATRLELTSDPTNPTEGPNEKYERIIESVHQIYEAAPKERCHNNSWVRQGTLNLHTEADAFTVRTRYMRADDPRKPRTIRHSNTLRARAKVSSYHDHDAYWQKEAEYLDTYARDSNCHWLHERLSMLREPLLRDAPANISLDQWSAHFETLLNVRRDVTEATYPASPPDPLATPMASGALTREEFDTALLQLKNFKSGGKEGIVAEALKYGPDTLKDQLFDLTAHCIEHSVVPDKFLVAKLLPHYKGKGSRHECGNYRGLSLLPVTGKILARVIKNRLQPYLETQFHEAQAGFRQGRGVVDQIFVTRQLMRASRRHGTPLAMAFIDIEKAYDSVDRPMMLRLLRSYGVAEDCVKLVDALYQNSSAFVTTPGKDGTQFNIHTGVRQGCLLSCLLFDVIMDAITRRFLAECAVGGVSINAAREAIRCLLYADDVVLFAHTPEDIQVMLACWDRISYEYGLITSVKKTKIMFVAKPDDLVLPAFSIRDQPVEVVTSFRYLGVTLTSDAQMDTEISTRVSSAHNAWNKYKYTVFLNKHLSMRTRVMMFKVTIVTALLYGAEAWAPTKDQWNRLEVVYNTLIRKMLGVQWWQHKSTEDVLSIARLPPFERYLASRTLRWQGHVARMSPDRFPTYVTDDEEKFEDLPAGVCKKKALRYASWTQQCQWATRIAVGYYPSRKVPHAKDIILDRDKWRYFTAPNDSGTSWDNEQRSNWINAFTSATTLEDTRPQARRPGNST